jgi:AcrR family transcriptional regulator
MRNRSKPNVSEFPVQSGRVEQMPARALKVLEGAVRVLGSRGLSDLSIESVCKVSGVSRATLYRYFATKDDLLEAVFEFICVEFEKGVTDEAARHQDPVARFAGVMDFLKNYTAERGLVRMFEADPGFHLVFFRSHFARHRAAVQAALDPVFDWIEANGTIVVVRPVSAERLIRLQISRLIIPFDETWDEAWASAATFAEEMMQHWIVVRPTPKTKRRKRVPDGDSRPTQK